MLKVKIILGSTRDGRFGEIPWRWIAALAGEQKDFEVESIDLRDWPLPFFNSPKSPSMVEQYDDPLVQKWAQKIAEADAFIIVTPEYNHSFTAVLKNALDVIYKEWNRKPVTFVGYGVIGAARAVEQLRGVAVELQMVPIRDAVHVSAFWAAFDDKGQPKDAALAEKAEAVFEQLTWWGEALKAARNK